MGDQNCLKWTIFLRVFIDQNYIYGVNYSRANFKKYQYYIKIVYVFKIVKDNSLTFLVGAHQYKIIYHLNLNFVNVKGSI